MKNFGGQYLHALLQANILNSKFDIEDISFCVWAYIK